MLFLLIIDKNVTPLLSQIYDKFVSEFNNESAYSIQWTSLIPAVNSEALVTMTMDPIEEKPIRNETCFLGQRLLNRRERLIVAENLGICVAKWRSPQSLHDAFSMFSDWKSEYIVYKSDLSFRRRGVFLENKLSISERWGGYNPKSDIFMEYLADDPSTYKLEVFYDSVLNFRKFKTLPIDNKRFHRNIRNIVSEPITPTILTIAEKLGHTLIRYGCCHFSVDFMLKDGAFKIIEINTCGVGRAESWGTNPKLYIQQLSEGVKSLYQNRTALESLNKMKENAKHISFRDCETQS